MTLDIATVVRVLALAQMYVKRIPGVEDVVAWSEKPGGQINVREV